MVYPASATFLIGVALSSFIHIGWVGTGLVLLIAFAFVLLAFVMKRSQRLFASVALILVSFSIGIARMDSAALVPDPHLEAVIGKQIQIEGVVVDDADVREHSVLLTVKAVRMSVASTTASIHSRLLVTAPAYSDGAYGDTVTVRGMLAIPAAFDTDTGRTFDYPGYLAVSGIAYELQNPKITITAHGKRNPIFAALFALKHWYVRGLAAALPEPAAALAGGITVGDKRSLGKELLDQFRTAGIVHIVVLSGYNVTIIAETLLKLLWWMPLRAGLLTGALGIALFAILTGGAASIVRASIMAILALVARALGRTYFITRGLAVAVVCMAFWNPWIVVHDPGFELSVLATIGLVFVSPLLEEKVRWVTTRFGIREVIVATLGTQATVLPFLLYQTGSLSAVSLPVNILVLAVVPAAMLLSFIAALVGMTVPVLAPLAGFPAYVLLSYMLRVVSISVAVPHASIAVPPFPLWLMLFAYVIIFAWLWLIYKKKAASPQGTGR